MSFINVERIKKLSEGDKEVPLYHKMLKLSEESGEVAQAFLAFDGAKNASASAGDLERDLMEEICDVLNVAIDIANNIDMTEEEKENLFNRKLDKWENKQSKFATIKNPKEGLTQINEISELAKKVDLTNIPS